MNKYKILIVEDEKITTIDLVRSLEGMGYHVMDSVASGTQAVSYIKEHLPDLVVINIGLKGDMNGMKTAQVIHQECEIPVVYLTVQSNHKTLHEGPSAQTYGYIVKPFKERELKTTLEIALFKSHMEQELKASEQRFREIFEQNYDAIILFKLEDFSVIDVNPAAVTVFGYSIDTLKTDFKCIFQDRDMYGLFEDEVSNINNRFSGVFLDRCHLKTKDHKQIICTVKANFIKLQNIDVLYCAFHDITEAVRIEDESRQLHTRLIETNKMTALGTLASGIAHEINNPNNFIMSNTQIIEQIWQDAIKILVEFSQERDDFSLGGLGFDEVKEVVPQLMQATLEGSRRIKTITDNLKEFSRPKEIDSYQKVAINDVMNFAIAMLANEIKKFTDSFSFTPGDSLPLFYGNSQQIEQVVVNLIHNALQSLPQRTCGVLVTSSFDEKEQAISVNIHDEGVGMNKEMMHRITDPFFTTKQDQGGTGLGLYVSYSIIQKHQGTMDFFSESGKGTTAIIKIPINANNQKE
jgi:PAS domain S-box-containing protein